ncbi:MAG: DEAD/DEAH box helicase [Armatimonadetes bacterium]|nr:DEAD/DEAH box helicase [Armatimonadota bacterium]MDE2205948.1 DEAD/DEAH box helicase [Armatimonadota bacterium]
MSRSAASQESTPAPPSQTEDVLAAFHPVVQHWFRSAFGTPSPPQQEGWPHIASRRNTLVCAPTGSGKTLTGFLAGIDRLYRAAFDGELKPETTILYVSPLKALSNDVQKNLREPLDGIAQSARELGLEPPEIKVLVRTGDTPQPEREAMIRRPPHILVTTPESLYILLTSDRSRRFLQSVDTVIVDEIHAVARDKRGSHLALSLERLEHLCGRPLQRVGLSATQNPVDLVARFLVGARIRPGGAPDCDIVNLGHLRSLDLSIETPRLPLEAVCSHETWAEIYQRLADLIEAHHTTLIFVNTRATCERLAQQLTRRLGEEAVTSHHGSLSRKQRLLAEQRLKAGELRALVATASLELGIDIGDVDLVCQIGPVKAIGTLLQRVGRAGHNLKAISKGILFALTLDDLATAAALSAAVRRHTLDRLIVPDKPTDILTQQIVAACACENWDADELFEMVRRAWPWQNLSREEFDAAVQMMHDGISTRRGRSGALITADGVQGTVRARRGARLAAITSGGAIPDTGDYLVIQEPENITVGTVHEDFAVESAVGDIFQLGNTSWRILRVETGRVRVEDAHGQPPSIPFWLGEAPARTAELSSEISRLRVGVEHALTQSSGAGAREEAVRWIAAETGIETADAEQLTSYLADTVEVLGALPTTDTLILERFFDESGGMQLVLHAPFGRRITWAWGLALRKRFCRGFNFELQAAASENAILLSLGMQHSFVLSDVFEYLTADTVQHLLEQAMLTSPVFASRWRWDACRSLALLRFSGGKKVPPALMRMRADDLLAAVFPHAAACPETLEGEDRDIPRDHPLVNEVLHDCLTEAMDIEGLRAVLRRIKSGEVSLIARDTVSPSSLATEIITVKPYAFLDDAPLEERRTQAVITRRSGAGPRTEAERLGALDSDAIARVRDEAWPDARDADELYDALMLTGYVTESEAAAFEPYATELLATGRAARVRDGAAGGHCLLVAGEMLSAFDAACPGRMSDTSVHVRAPRTWTQEDALLTIVRGRLEALGPLTTSRLADELDLPTAEVENALIGLETQGVALRGHYSPDGGELEWCDRRLLARIHRYTLDRLRREISPVSAADFVRFLFEWQHAAPGTQLTGISGLRQVVGMLDGCEAAAVAWEESILPLRMHPWLPADLDTLCLSGEVRWGRLHCAERSPGRRSAVSVKQTPIGLYQTASLPIWARDEMGEPGDGGLSGAAVDVLDVLTSGGPQFFGQLVSAANRLPVETESALAELVSAGLVTSDGFGGLRTLITPASRRNDAHRARALLAQRNIRSVFTHAAATNRLSADNQAGRWSLLRSFAPTLAAGSAYDEACEYVARQLLRRWGVVFHRITLREQGLPPWRDILRVYRRMELAGDLRGGRFVAGFSGEQYALPEAVESLRGIRRRPPNGQMVRIAAADPLNLSGIITPGERIAARSGSRILYRDGVPQAVLEGGDIRMLTAGDEAAERHAFEQLRRGNRKAPVAP